MSSKIVLYLKDRAGYKYKIEEVSEGTLLGGRRYWYNVLNSSNSILFKNFNHKSEAIRYLEEHKGPCFSY